MATDPYGYAEETAQAPADLSRVLWYGVGALMCAAVGPCLCYLPYLAAIPLGWMAIQQSKTARSSAVPLERTVGSVAQTSGIVGLAFGVLAVAGITLYAFFLGGALAFGALGDRFNDVEPDLTAPEALDAPLEGAFEGEPGGDGLQPTEGSPTDEGGIVGEPLEPTPTPPADMLQE